MNVLWSCLQALFILLFPYFAYKLARLNKVLRYISPVVLCYVGGIFLTNLPFFSLNHDISRSLSEVSIPLAIPLVVFSLDIKKWMNNAGKAAFSFLLCVISAVASVLLSMLIFSNFQYDLWKLAGMSIGVYTGGTPNMSAIGMALEVEEELFVLMNAADVVLGGAYLVFLMTIAHPLLGRFLPAYKSGNQKTEIDREVETFHQQSFKSRLKYIIFGLLMTAICLVAGVGISMILFGRISVVSIIVTITTMAVAGSFIRPIRRMPGTFEVGEYLLLIFCVAIGSLVNLEQLFNNSGEIFYYLAFVMITAIFFHYLLALIFRIDVDTLLITSVAGIYGPAFVPPIASVMKNKQIIITGLTTGILGYAIANYVGLLIAYLLNGGGF